MPTLICKVSQYTCAGVLRKTKDFLSINFNGCKYQLTFRFMADYLFLLESFYRGICLGFNFFWLSDKLILNHPNSIRLSHEILIVMDLLSGVVLS